MLCFYARFGVFCIEIVTFVPGPNAYSCHFLTGDKWKTIENFLFVSVAVSPSAKKGTCHSAAESLLRFFRISIGQTNQIGKKYCNNSIFLLFVYIQLRFKVDGMEAIKLRCDRVCHFSWCVVVNMCFCWKWHEKALQ